jgi:hypothetical protein
MGSARRASPSNNCRHRAFLARPELGAGELVTLSDPIVKRASALLRLSPQEEGFSQVNAFRDRILTEASAPETDGGTPRGIR